MSKFTVKPPAKLLDKIINVKEDGTTITQFLLSNYLINYLRYLQTQHTISLTEIL